MIQQNISNLVSLWNTMSQPFNGCGQTPYFQYQYLEEHVWPNRICFTSDITAQGLKRLTTFLKDKQTPFTIPYWDVYQSESETLLKDAGFIPKNEQYAMVLKLSKSEIKKSPLSFLKVETRENAALWSHLFFRAFNYQIHPDLIYTSRESVQSFIVYTNEDPVGTVMYYQTGSVAGIHALGILPEKRRNGFAESIMYWILDYATLHNATHATLQASIMGMHLYEKLGFNKQFRIQNFITG